jgi:hypothetical protein
MVLYFGTLISFIPIAWLGNSWRDAEERVSESKLHRSLERVS